MTVQPFSFADLDEFGPIAPAGPATSSPSPTYNTNRAWSVCDVKNMGTSKPQKDDYYPQPNHDRKTIQEYSNISDTPKDVYLHKRPTFDVSKPYSVTLDPSTAIFASPSLTPSSIPSAAPAIPSYASPSSSGSAPVVPSVPPVSKSNIFPSPSQQHDNVSSKNDDEKAEEENEKDEQDEVTDKDTKNGGKTGKASKKPEKPLSTNSQYSDDNNTTIYITLYTITGILLIFILEQFTRIGIQLRWHF